MTAKYEPLATVISYFIDQHDKSVGDEDKYWILGFRALSLLHQNISAEPKTLRLPVNANQTVNYPPDYIDWWKVGILNNNSEVVTLRVNKALTTFSSLSPNRLTNIGGDINSGWASSSNSPYVNFFNNGMYQPLFGVGNAGVVTYGDCRMDDANKVIILSPTFQYTHIILEYVSSPERDVDYVVDVRLREAIIAFIEWKTKLGSRQDFYAAAVEANRMLKPVKSQSINQTLRLNEKMTLIT